MKWGWIFIFVYLLLNILHLSRHSGNHDLLLKTVTDLFTHKIFLVKYLMRCRVEFITNEYVASGPISAFKGIQTWIQTSVEADIVTSRGENTSSAKK